MSAYVLAPKAVRTLKRIVRGNASSTTSTFSPATISPDDYAAPYTVAWSQSEDSGSGAWVIWTPNPAQMLIYDSTAVTITGITAATELPAGWYTIDALQSSSTAVYLVLTIDESTGTADAELSDSAGQASTSEQVVNILVATMATDSSTGAKRVKQYVDSTVTLGAGSGVTPDDVSTEFIPQPAGGATPDGDEGKLQLKGFKTGTPADTNNIADYLMGAANMPNGMSLVCRWTDSDGGHLVYLPIAELYQSSSGGSPHDITVDFVGDIDWYVNGSIHQLRKRLKVLNLRTGAVSDKANTTYANGWEVAANSTPISQIIGS